MLDTQLILKLLASFMIGSIPFAVISMWGSGTNIRDVGSGNPGFNNVLRFDKRRALIALIGDVAKGCVPVWLFYGDLAVLEIGHVDVAKGYVPIWLFYGPGMYSNFGWLFGMAAVFGHCYSPWLKFQGGKGIATSAGAMLAMYPGVAAMALAFFVPVRVVGGRFKIKEIGAWASMLTWVFFTVVIHFLFGMPHTKYAALMTIFLVWRHKSNIARMLERSTNG